MKLRMASAFIAIVVMIALTACGSGSGDDKERAGTEAVPLSADAKSATANAKPAEAKKIVVGTGTSFKSLFYLDENGKLTGYDVELVRELDRRLPEYEFEFTTNNDFMAQLLSLETGKIDLIAQQLSKNAEREQKYLFNQIPYAINPTRLMVRDDNNEINTLEDLKDKKIMVSAGSTNAKLLEELNRKQGDHAFKIVQASAGDDIINQLKLKRVDAVLGTPLALDIWNKERGANLKLTGPVLATSEVYFVMRKDEAELRQKIDEALQALIDDGTLSKLSIEWLGADYTKPPE